ncbi:MAG: response regulator transcription factor [Myxococcales bacterium]|nr:response regulator transcription factor [Myxococcales bacterium]
MARILIVEDDENLRLVLQDNLEDEGYQVIAAGTAAEARAALAGEPFDLLVLDIMLPDGDGYSLCRDYRAGGGAAGVLMLTARTLEDDLVRGFEVGADDYLAKPYRLRELLARVAALLRRAGAGPRVLADRLGRFTLDRTGRRVLADAGEVHLTRTEFDLLVFLLDRPGVALDRDAILDGVWGTDVVVDTRTVDNFVHNLKKKLGWSPADPWAIETVRGVGYRMALGG